MADSNKEPEAPRVALPTLETPTLTKAELAELLFPVAQHVRLHAAQIADLTDGEVTFGRNGGKRFLH